MLGIRALFITVAVLAGVGPAAASTLSGTTFCGSNRMVGATVRALYDASGADANVATTNGSGDYTMELADGIYDLVITPPAGSPCSAGTVPNKTVDGATSVNIFFAPPQGPGPVITYVQISGHVTVDGVDMPGWYVSVYDDMDENSYETQTDASGNYVLSVPTGTYNVSVGGSTSGTAVPTPAGNVSCSSGYQSFSTATVKDFSAATATVTGTVLKASNNEPIVGIRANVSTSKNYGAFTCGGSGGQNTDAQGRFGPIRVLASASGTASSAFVQAQYNGASTPVTTNAGGNVDVTLRPTAIVTSTISGYFRTASGEPVTFAEVEAADEWDEHYFSATTDEEGYYSITVTPGTYRVTAWNSNQISGLPASFSCSGGWLDVQGAMFQDFTVRGGYLQGTVKFTGTLDPAVGVSVSVSGSYSESTQSCGSSRSVTTNASGAFGPVAILGGSTGRASVGSVFGQWTGGSASTTVPADGTGTVEVLLTRVQSYSISGHFTANGVQLTDYEAEVTDPWEEQYYATSVDEEGRYSSTLANGEYAVNTYWSGPGNNTPKNLSCRTDGLVLNNASLVVDHVIAGYVKVSGQVTTANGVPIPGVRIGGSTSKVTGNTRCTSSTQLNSDAEGRFTYWLMPGTASFSLNPPSGSGFSSFSASNIALQSNYDQAYVLPLPDTTPPTLVGDPLVIHHSNTKVSIQWRTNEPTDAVLEYQVGATLGADPLVVTRTALVTDHIITLSDLDPLTQYAYRVTSKDAPPYSNAVTSPVLTFTTVELPDIEPPQIIDGPEVTYLAPSQIRVHWLTNEPATSRVDYLGPDGTPRHVESSDSALEHDLLIVGLSASTTYSLTVSSSDPDGNGPTASAPFDVTTPATTDRTAPVLSNLHTECVTHEAMAVCWDTDEPANSNVAYTNTNTNATATLSEDALVTTRCLSVTGLQASTQYRVNVSSADGGQNAGTAPPIYATTLASASEGAPQISAFVAEYASPTSARITWKTDVASSTFVRYGTNPANLNLSAGNLAASEKDHAWLLTGLPANTTIYVQVSATNPCHQVSVAGPTPIVEIDECQTAGACASGECENTFGGFVCQHAPTIADQELGVATGVAVGAVVGTIAANDVDGQSIQFAKVSGDAAGALALSGGGVVTVSDPGKLVAGQAITLVVRVSDTTQRTAEATITVQVARVDECASDNGGCDQRCIELDDGYACDCDEGFGLAGDGHSCVAVGTCDGNVSCDPEADTLVFYGVVGDADGNPVGSFRCERAPTGAITCETENGALKISDTLWCE